MYMNHEKSKMIKQVKFLTIIIMMGFWFFNEALSAENSKKTAESSPASAVMLENILTKLKLKGRAAVGYFNSQKDGLYRHSSFEVPDVKLVFGFKPDDVLDLVIRFNLNNGAANSPLTDYVYLQAKDFISPLKDTPWSLSGRLGRFKLGVGEETWSNNPIEGVLPSNSAANIDGTDEGLELSGKFWAFSISNGQRGFNSETGEAKAWLGKLFYSPWDPLYMSATYYDSGSLKTSQAEVPVAGTIDRPTNATNWKRQIGMADVRFDFQKGSKSLNPPSGSDSKAFIRLSYGQFEDSATKASDRKGKFGFMDITYNCSSKIYTGAKVSFIDLDGSQTASLNGVSANHYERYSWGAGYRWSDNVQIKAGYDHNRNGGAGTKDVKDDLISALLTIRL